MSSHTFSCRATVRFSALQTLLYLCLHLLLSSQFTWVFTSQASVHLPIVYVAFLQLLNFHFSSDRLFYSSFSILCSPSLSLSLLPVSGPAQPSLWIIFNELLYSMRQISAPTHHRAPCHRRGLHFYQPWAFCVLLTSLSLSPSHSLLLFSSTSISVSQSFFSPSPPDFVSPSPSFSLHSSTPSFYPVCFLPDPFPPLALLSFSPAAPVLTVALY